jgi:hypothetical protein
MPGILKKWNEPPHSVSHYSQGAKGGNRAKFVVEGRIPSDRLRGKKSKTT